MPEDKTEKPQVDAPPSNVSDWLDNFEGSVRYDKNGIAVVEPLNQKIPFDIVYKGDERKIISRGTDIEKHDVGNLPNLNKKDLNDNISRLSAFNDGKKPNAQITNQNRSDWNSYISYLRGKGLAGDTSLDTNNYGNKVLSDYIKDNPNTSLTPDLIPAIQHDFTNYRQYALDQIKSGKGVFAEGVNEDNFMTHLSKTDGWSGSETTKHLFPKEYMDYIEQNKPEQTVEKGFAVADQTVTK